MIEVAYEDFEKYLEQYFKELLNGKECITVCKDGRKIVLMDNVNYRILNSAFEIAQSILEK